MIKYLCIKQNQHIQCFLFQRRRNGKHNILILQQITQKNDFYLNSSYQQQKNYVNITIFNIESQMWPKRLHFSHFNLKFQSFSRSFYNKQQAIIKMPNNSRSQRVNVFIRLDNGNGCSLIVEKKQTLDQLVNAINNQEIELPQVYRILFRGSHIKDFTKTVEEVGITENSILHIEEVYERGGRPMRMDVCIFWNGEKYIVKSQSSEKILNLKHKIHKLLKVIPKEQLLVFKGYILENNETLEHYRIKPDSLICLHSTAKMADIDDAHSDYEQIGEGFMLKDNELLESVLSLGEKKSGASKSTLFRSDSMGMKNIQEPLPYQIEIHHKGTNEDNDSQNQRGFNFDLFKSFGMANPMTLSIGYNLFDSMKHPIDRFTFKTFQIKSEDEQQFDERQEMKCESLVDSISSFENI